MMMSKRKQLIPPSWVPSPIPVNEICLLIMDPRYVKYLIIIVVYKEFLYIYCIFSLTSIAYIFIEMPFKQNNYKHLKKKINQKKASHLSEKEQ